MAQILQRFLTKQLKSCKLKTNEEGRNKSSSTKVRVYKLNSIVYTIYLMPIIRFKRNDKYFFLTICHRTVIFCEIKN